MSIKKSDKVLKNNRRALCVGEIFDILNADTDDELDVVTAIPPKMFDDLTDEEDIDDQQLYGDESIDIARTFEIQAKNDSEGALNMECIGNIRQSKGLAGDTPSKSTLTHKRIRILSLQHKDTGDSSSSLKDVPQQFPSPCWQTVKKDANLPFATSNNPEQLNQLVEDIEGKLTNRHSTYFYTLMMKALQLH